ncbi:MAG: DUF4082 domain-containing protein [Bryobacteraceae bacterium]
MIKNLALPFILLCAFGAVNARANYLGLTPPSVFDPGTGAANNPVNLGLFFTTSSTITIDELGFYDIPDLTSGETVTLYTSTGTALTSVLVPTTATLDDGYFMESITPFVLTAGEYVVTAFTGNNPWEYASSVATGAGITFVQENYDYASGPAFPSGGVGDAAGVYYGPTFDVSTSQSTVPEPGTWMMLTVGLGVLGLVRRGRVTG